MERARAVSMKPVSGYLLAAALLFAAGWLARVVTLRPDPALLASADSLARVVATADSLRREASRADSLADLRAAELLARGSTHQRRAATLGQAAAHLTDTLRVLVTDSGALAVLDSMGRLHAAEVAALDSAVKDAEGRAEVFRGRWLAYRDTLLPEVVAQRDRAQELLRRAIVQTRRGHRWKTDAVLLVLGALGGLALSR